MKATMMTLAFAALAMTANANPHGNTWRNANPAPRTEVRHHNNADWRHCRHNHIDRYAGRTFCNHCGAELVWRGGRYNGHYDVIPPRPVMHNQHHGGAPVPPPPGHNARPGYGPRR